ncbi:hypothetical protein ABW19_dt0200288 [Dactylella cylindrospora]|nr:hypothetical protein ABW19_dt0200288 [Dactylella cylindrospora]
MNNGHSSAHVSTLPFERLLFQQPAGRFQNGSYLLIVVPYLIISAALVGSAWQQDCDIDPSLDQPFRLTRTCDRYFQICKGKTGSRFFHEHSVTGNVSFAFATWSTVPECIFLLPLMFLQGPRPSVCLWGRLCLSSLTHDS